MNKYEMFIFFFNREPRSKLMGDGSNAENSSDQHGYTNGRTTKVFKKK
jgi:hypothetical protein